MPEGEDKVAKYPTLFQPADVILLNKMDLAEALEFDKSVVEGDLARVNTRAPVIEVSAKTGLGMDEWVGWLEERYREQLSQTAGVQAVAR